MSPTSRDVGRHRTGDAARAAGLSTRPAPGHPHGGRLPAAEASRLFSEYRRTRDPAIRERLVGAHFGLAASLASRFSSRNETPEDLHQAALLGLVHAIDRFDPDRGVQFTTFAWATISGELKRHFRDRTWGVRVPRRLQELYLNTSEATDSLTHDLGRSPTVAEVAERVGCSEEDVLEALEARAAYRLGSIDAPVGSDDADAGMQLPESEQGFGRVEQRVVLDGLLNRLPVRERQIIHLRFNEELTQAEIADRVGVSQMHVSRLLSGSLQKLRVWATEGAA
ncbi:MAG TPA: SigB/SigF/SigG family RNA polymerase sigma factor [Acidimicrobiales bacterium]|nr:SigB/SigF/SigG family RNA polymerase sigma factor [Acidimicrobiales bacterium]